MFNISSYLEKAVSVVDKAFFNTQTVTGIINKHTGITKENNFFEIKDGILRTNLTPAEKMMLFMKKEALLLELAPYSVKEIR